MHVKLRAGEVDLSHDATHSSWDKFDWACHGKHLRIAGEDVPWTPGKTVEWKGVTWRLKSQG